MSVPRLAPVPDVTPAEPTLAEDAARYLGLLAQSERITSELNRIKTRLRTELAPGDHDLDGVAVKISQPTVFDPALAAGALSAQELADITETKTWVSPALAAELLDAEQLAAISETSTSISGVLAKAKLTPATYRACCKASGTARVSVK